MDTIQELEARLTFSDAELSDMNDWIDDEDAGSEDADKGDG